MEARDGGLNSDGLLDELMAKTKSRWPKWCTGFDFHIMEKTKTGGTTVRHGQYVDEYVEDKYGGYALGFDRDSNGPVMSPEFKAALDRLRKSGRSFKLDDILIELKKKKKKKKKI